MHIWDNVYKLIGLYEDIQNNNTVIRVNDHWEIHTTEDIYKYNTTSALVEAILYELTQLFELEV